MKGISKNNYLVLLPNPYSPVLEKRTPHSTSVEPYRPFIFRGAAPAAGSPHRGGDLLPVRRREVAVEEDLLRAVAHRVAARRRLEPNWQNRKLAKYLKILQNTHLLGTKLETRHTRVHPYTVIPDGLISYQVNPTCMTGFLLHASGIMNR